MASIYVLGAGVIGLSSAIELLRQGYHVHLVAKDAPVGTLTIRDPVTFASPKAGMVWSSFAKPDDKRMQDHEWNTYLRFQKEAKEGVPGVGAYPWHVQVASGTRVEKPWFAERVPEWRETDQGFSYQSVYCNPEVYMQSLMETFVQLGGVLEQRSVESLQEVVPFSSASSTEKTPLVLVHCSGLGARSLRDVQDSKVIPVRGQVLIARPKQPPAGGTFGQVSEEHFSYMIPRTDGTYVLGGTAEEGVEDLEPHADTTKSILERVGKHVPDMEWEVVRASVGLRPWRQNGYRLEKEYVRWGERPVWILHNYGHGYAGWQLSWGCAEEVVRMVKEVLSDADNE